MQTICIDGSQKLPLNGFKWEKNVSNFDEDTLLKYMLNIPKGFVIFKMIYHFYQKKWKLKNVKSLFVDVMIKTTML